MSPHGPPVWNPCFYESIRKPFPCFALKAAPSGWKHNSQLTPLFEWNTRHREEAFGDLSQLRESQFNKGQAGCRICLSHIPPTHFILLPLSINQKCQPFTLDFLAVAVNWILINGNFRSTEWHPNARKTELCVWRALLWSSQPILSVVRTREWRWGVTCCSRQVPGLWGQCSLQDSRLPWWHNLSSLQKWHWCERVWFPESRIHVVPGETGRADLYRCYPRPLIFSLLSGAGSRGAPRWSGKLLSIAVPWLTGHCIRLLICQRGEHVSFGHLLFLHLSHFVISYTPLEIWLNPVVTPGPQAVTFWNIPSLCDISLKVCWGRWCSQGDVAS